MQSIWTTLALRLGGKSGCSRAVLEFMALPPIDAHAYQQNLRHVRSLHYIIGAHGRTGSCLLACCSSLCLQLASTWTQLSGQWRRRLRDLQWIPRSSAACLTPGWLLHAALRAAAAEHHQPKSATTDGRPKSMTMQVAEQEKTRSCPSNYDDP